MILEAVDGSTFRLEAQGYQFPGGSGFDSEWLIVEGRVETPVRSWSFRDPALTTGELPQIAAWLLSATNPSWPGTLLDFIEPNLSFDRVAIGEEHVTIRVGFDLEAKPAAIDDEDGAGDPYLVDFVVSKEACARAAAQLANEAREFQRRNI